MDWSVADTDWELVTVKAECAVEIVVALRLHSAHQLLDFVVPERLPVDDVAVVVVVADVAVVAEAVAVVAADVADVVAVVVVQTAYGVYDGC